MGIITKTFERKGLGINFYDGRSLSSRGYTADNSFFSELSYSSSDAGISISAETALNYTAYWACVRLLAETMASLPFILYQRLEPRGKNRAANHPLYRILHDEPNPEMDSFSYIETLMYHLVAANGNAYSFIDWDDTRTEIKALWLMSPERVTKFRADDGLIYFKYQPEKGGIINLPAYRVWHIPGFGYDGMKGYTPLTYARNQIGLGVGAERMGSKLFANGLTFGGFLEHSGHMSDPAQTRFKKQLEAGYQGVDKAHKLLILEEGMKYSKNFIAPNDAQWLETRKLQRNEMSSFFRIPPHMIGDLERATFSNIEEQALEFTTYTIRPWAVRWERSANRQLLNEKEKGGYFTEFLLDAILRADIMSRYQAYSIGINWGILCPDEAREKENMNPAPDGQGEAFMRPANMLPASEFEAQRPKPAARQQQPAEP